MKKKNKFTNFFKEAKKAAEELRVDLKCSNDKDFVKAI